MKRHIRILSFVLVMVLVLTVPAQAEEVTPRSSSYFTSYTAYLYQTSSTQFQIWFDVLATKTMDKIGVSWINIQRSTDGENWETVATEYSADHPEMMNEDLIYCLNYITYTGTAGYYYRARVRFYAKNAAGSGVISYTTSALIL